jgi:hypothetical protein
LAEQAAAENAERIKAEQEKKKADNATKRNQENLAKEVADLNA